ncbi:MAG: 4Fe-4S binding protein [Prevotellaceae bacterium]|nr:4Fe-4S binding protein [Prevotellaceae bacterium]
MKEILVGIYRLLQGMAVTMRNMIRPKITEPYPENRTTAVPFERRKSVLQMPHNGNNQHRCTACLICMNSCPNGTIQIEVKKEIDPETGKEKRVLGSYKYDLGSCTFCELCTIMCPQDAISWSQDFENSVFTRSKLNLKLNAEGSSLIKKEPVAKEVAG